MLAVSRNTSNATPRPAPGYSRGADTTATTAPLTHPCRATTWASGRARNGAQHHRGKGQDEHEHRDDHGARHRLADGDERQPRGQPHAGATLCYRLL